MSKYDNDAAATQKVRELLDDWQSAVLAGDVPRIMNCYGPDVVAFDAIQTLRFVGREAYAGHWQYCMTLCPGPMIFELHDITIHVAGELAFCHYLSRCGSGDDKGEEQAGWMRATICLRQIDGHWKVLHEHFSAPFDVESGKALLALQP